MFNIIELKDELLNFNKIKRQKENTLYSLLKDVKEIIKKSGFYDNFILMEKDNNYYNNRVYPGDLLQAHLNHKKWNKLSINEFLKKRYVEESLSIDSDHLSGDPEKYIVVLSIENTKTLMLSYHHEYDYDGDVHSDEDIVFFEIPLEKIQDEESLLAELQVILNNNNIYIEKFHSDLQIKINQEAIKKEEKVREDKLKQFENLKKELGL